MSRNKKNNYKVLIGVLSGILAVLLVVALVFSLGTLGSDKPQPSTLLSTKPTSSSTTKPTEPPGPPPVVKTGTATIGATGDVLMHMACVRPGLQSDGTYDYAPYFAHVQDYFKSVDYAVANLETTLAGTNNGYPYSGYPNFNCPDGIVTSLKNAGFDMLLTANNHTYDTKSIGFFRTQEVIMQNGLDHIGTKPDAETDSYLIKEINGIKIGMVCYTYETNADPDKVDLNGGTDLKESEKGLINTFLYVYDNEGNLHIDTEKFAQDLEQNYADMKTDGAEAVVLYIHWGNEYQTKNNKYQTQMAQIACDLGVDVIVGGHPHVIQPIDLLESKTDPTHKTVCLYSTGNLLSNQRLGNISYVKTAHTEDGIFFTFSFAKYSDGTVRLEQVNLLPLWVNMYTSKQTGKVVYDILPLDDQIEDWKTQLELSDATLTKAQASYERTMKIIGTGKQRVEAYLQSLSPIEE